MEKDSIETIKRALSDELVSNLRMCDDTVFEDLVYFGYSSEEVMDMITRYNNTSGADLINCNEVVKKTLVRKNSKQKDKNI